LLIEWLIEHCSWFPRDDRGHNIENGVIYDFGSMLQGNRIHMPPDIGISWSSLSSSQIKEFSEILYFFKEYIIKYCNEYLSTDNISEEMRVVYETIKSRTLMLSAIDL
jgi:hypothetical protein